jgi:hypothetical protein
VIPISYKSEHASRLNFKFKTSSCPLEPPPLLASTMTLALTRTLLSKKDPKMPPPQLPSPQPSMHDHRDTQGARPKHEHSSSIQPAFSSAQPKVPNLPEDPTSIALSSHMT